MRLIPGILVCALILSAVLAGNAEPVLDKKKGSLPGPSENAGRKGTYRCDTLNGMYKYFVFVPESYTADNPAGLHLFFHGQGSQKGAESFWQWKRRFLEPYNLIGINMQYNDGDNASDTTGKVEAAKAAIAQTMADYKIVAGRGAVSSFSGGGLPHGMFFSQKGRAKQGRGIEWPFCHMALYGSNFRNSVHGAMPMSWFVGLGEKEWDMAGLGRSQTARAYDILAGIPKGGPADIYLKLTKGKGHSISDEDVAASAAAFRRADLAYAPFLYEPDFKEPELVGIVNAANQNMLGPAMKALTVLLKKKKIAPELRVKAEKVKEAITSRSHDQLALTRELAQTDRMLFKYYAALFYGGCKGLPVQRELGAEIQNTHKLPDYKKAEKGQTEFIKKFNTFFRNGAKITTDAAQILTGIQARVEPSSLVGMMCAEFLEHRINDDGL